jgi:hypothetical protein
MVLSTIREDTLGPDVLINTVLSLDNMISMINTGGELFQPFSWKSISSRISKVLPPYSLFIMIIFLYENLKKYIENILCKI